LDQRFKERTEKFLCYYANIGSAGSARNLGSVHRRAVRSPGVCAGLYLPNHPQLEQAAGARV